MKLIRITDPNNSNFNQLITLYKEAFPVSERREIEQLKRLVEEKDKMFFNAIECDGELCGLFIYWKFEEFYYLEHLAVYAEVRNRKIGQQVLDYITANLQGLRLLEVEPAESEMTTRRVNYYRRNGYEVLDYDYMQPSYHTRGESLPLWIMGNHPTTRLHEFEEQIRQEIYWKNL